MEPELWLGAVSDGVEKGRRARPQDELERVGTQSVKGGFPSYVYCTLYTYHLNSWPVTFSVWSGGLMLFASAVMLAKYSTTLVATTIVSSYSSYQLQKYMNGTRKWLILFCEYFFALNLQINLNQSSTKQVNSIRKSWNLSHLSFKHYPSVSTPEPISVIRLFHRDV